ncbi:glycoside hydrolase family 2 protein, partial [Actinosynnema sp. NPDC023658]
PPRSAAPLDLADDLLEPADPKGEVLVAVAGDVRTHHLFGEDLDLDYHPAPFTAAVAPVVGGYRVTVRATSYVRDVGLLADKVAADAVVDDMLVSLTAGEAHHFLVRTSQTLPDPAVLLDLRVLRCANTIIGGDRPPDWPATLG